MAGELLEYLASEPWFVDAQCQGTDNGVFFPDERGAAVRNTIRLAKSICMSCTVRDQCLDYAIESKQIEGIWGGLTPKERKKYRRPRA